MKSPLSTGPARAHGATSVRTLFVLAVLSLSLGTAALTVPVLAAPSITADCVPSAYTSPSSLRIPNAQPSGPQSNFAAGTVISVTVQYQVDHFQRDQAGIEVSLPTIQASFHEVSGSTIAFDHAPQTTQVSGPGWTKLPTFSHTTSTSGTFSTGDALLSTNWMAVQAPVPYGSLQLSFQWAWTVVPPSGPATTGHWSPAVTQSNTGEQPTTFYPAPLVTVLGTAPLDEPAGGTTWVNMGGNVSGTSFRFVIETPTGHEVRSSCNASPTGATSFNDIQPLQSTDGSELPAGTYLIHVHNAGGAIVVFSKVIVQ